MRIGGYFPQGQPQNSETLVQAAVRECLEEVGLNILITSLLGVYEDFLAKESKDNEIQHVTIVCYVGDVVHGEVRTSSEAKEHAWIDPGHPPSTCPTIVKRILHDYCNRERTNLSLG